MQGLYHAVAHNSSSELPLGEQSSTYAFSDSFTPHAFDAAWTCYLHDDLSRDVGEPPTTSRSQNILSDDEQRIWESSQAALSFDEPEYNLEASHFAPRDFFFYLGDQSGPRRFGPEERPFPISNPGTLFPSGIEAFEFYISGPNSSSRSTSLSSDFPSESLVSLPSISSVVAANEQRRDSISSLGSWNGIGAFDNTKRAISSLRNSRKAKKNCNDLYRCQECGESVGFRHRKDLGRHQLSVHSGQPRWFCPIQTCKFSTQGFIRKDKSLQHVRTHRGHPNVNFQPIWGGAKIEGGSEI